MADPGEKLGITGALGDEKLAAITVELDQRLRTLPELGVGHRNDVIPAAFFWAQAQHLGRTGISYVDSGELYDAISRQIPKTD